MSIPSVPEIGATDQCLHAAWDKNLHVTTACRSWHLAELLDLPQTLIPLGTAAAADEFVGAAADVPAMVREKETGQRKRAVFLPEPLSYV